MENLTKKIPQKGYVIAYLKEELVFAPYTVAEGRLLVRGYPDIDIRKAQECHFFDSDTELRLVQRRARGDVIETLLTAAEEAAMDPDLIFTEQLLTKPQYASLGDMPSKLTIVNRYRYSENDTLVLEDYRISC